MKAQPQPAETRGQPVRRPARPIRPAVQPDGLHRYTPVPPAYRDADGYLVEDGMGQSNEHLCQTTLWYHALKRRLPAATVCSDLFLHYRQGDRGAVLAPDLFVALRAPPIKGRTAYKLWQHPVPDLVIEMLSESNPEKDLSNRDTYAHLGVRECWLFDPAGFKLATPLVGYRLRARRYQQIGADAAGRLRSKVLGLDLHVHAGELRFRDPATRKDLRTYDESEDRGDAEQNRADAAERERAAEKERADAVERERAAEKERADVAERQLATAERELARLRQRLGDS